MRPPASRHPRDRGQATTELALLLPVVVVLLLSVLQLGLVARDVLLVTHAAREAARAAAVDDAPGAARRAALAGSGLRSDRLQVTQSGRAGYGSRVLVRVTYRIPTTVPIIGALLPDPRVTSTAAMRVEVSDETAICANAPDLGNLVTIRGKICADHGVHRRIRRERQRIV